MKSILQFLLRGFVSFNVFAGTSLIAFFGLEMSVVVALLSGTVVGVGSNLFLRFREKQRLLQENRITSKEYRYIKGNLKEAAEKIKRINKSILGIRSIQAAKQIGRLQRITSRVYQIVKKEPRRFYQGERFFFNHLDSIVEVTERYIFLTKHQSKDSKIRETEETLDKLYDLVEEDLRMVLAKDVEDLAIELDIANRSYNRDKQHLPKERS